MTDSCYGSATPLENQSDQQVLKEKKEKENVNKPEVIHLFKMVLEKRNCPSLFPQILYICEFRASRRSP